jgi:ribose 5-phosphate isomerase B|tara:strand:- start:5123 stop:5551 length:429 start_codon:yes stop_codon:yes gene_type:complete
MKIAIGSDHAGFQLKKNIINKFKDKIDFKDVGTYSEESVDYPDYAHLAAKELISNKVERVILICGSGNGIQMTANKHNNIRCALCWNEEITHLARQHNDANAISLPARFINENVAEKIVEAFIKTTFEGGRHQKRTKKINAT